MAWNWKKQASMAYGYALTHLALGYSIYIDGKNDEEQQGLTWAEEQLQQAMEQFVAGQENLDTLQALRQQLSDEMMVMVAYTDCFRIYEYALNRLERRFDTTLPPLQLSDEACAERLYGFILAAENSAVMNQRIQLVVEQLPIRFTRQKFYAMVQEALSAYIGSDQSSLDQIMYLIRCSAMVEIGAEQENRYPQLKELLERLKTLFSDWKTMDSGQYKEAQDVIALASETLFVNSDCYQIVEELVNDLYILALTRADAVKNTEEESAAMGILTKLQEAPETVEETMEALYQLEGVQEQYFEKYQRLNPPPEAEADELPAARYGRMVDRLLSSSSFALLEEDAGGSTVTRSDVERAAGQFFEQLNGIIAEHPKPVVRAVMATVLSNLPVCFNSPDELWDYIKNSLAGCTDSAEKETCMELLEQVMENEAYASV